MTVQAILLPVFAQVALIFVLALWMLRERAGALRRGEVRIGDIVLGQPAWPARATQVSNSFHNQLQLPLLFFVLVILAMMTRKADLLFVAMSWLFVATRILHVAVHTGSNRLGLRFGTYAAGFVLLLAMWVIFALRILLVGVEPV
ncbi:MAG: MAPEG family protein [Inquilinus limosus]|uniref:MAPEG family protein n=1 Tax=Inquilinus limosus TaxID=171674 RepID=A0A952FM27_9PROT|nr:MAPEG family protein [Inquilinus limosus]